ncbi:type II toxin-antitoxin system prevent-host-death family antitoxin [Streptomyces sp. V17-9]|uniref:type II toxin-antitoxin system prevent-host-death family antitoxin n=1 Tax=Streptomyces sp. V17-9 TaxID=2831149 RepID=UPI001BB0A372|nr:type II toxin-antitoxin system prevent-host-death family antitoxin [Streptomyces sp. V17-9]QUW90940.1 Antitoxin RelJ [Streptomyces sp. V17-9]
MPVSRDGRPRHRPAPPPRQVGEDAALVHDSRREGDVPLAPEEYSPTCAETLYLLRSPTNARRLLDSITEARAAADPRAPEGAPY